MPSKTQNAEETSADTNSDESTDQDATSNRSDAIDVTDSDQSLALLAAFRGVYNFFKGRVEKWVQNDDGTISANGFTVDAKYDPETILKDISGRDRRIDFPAALRYFQGTEPEPFTDPAEMTNFLVNFTKGQGGEGNSKTPEYARNAVSAYKAEMGMKNRRGRKRVILRLDNLNELDEAAIAETSPEQIDKLVALIEQTRARRNGANSSTPVEANA